MLPSTLYQTIADPPSFIITTTPSPPLHATRIYTARSECDTIRPGFHSHHQTHPPHSTIKINFARRSPPNPEPNYRHRPHHHLHLNLGCTSTHLASQSKYHPIRRFPTNTPNSRPTDPLCSDPDDRRGFRGELFEDQGYEG